MKKISAAIDERILDLFSLRVHRDDKSADTTETFPYKFDGHYHRKTTKEIFIEMEEKQLHKFISVYETGCSFDFHFRENRMPYQLQHHALTILKGQNLFDLLINNTAYDKSVTTKSNRKSNVKESLRLNE